MKLIRFSIALLAFATLLMVADAICTDFGTWSEYRSKIASQKAEIQRLEADLYEYQRLTTTLKHKADIAVK